MAAPRWKTAISNALEKNSKSVVIQLATIENHSQGIHIPKVRSCIFRSFLEPSSSPAHPLILSSTDIRSPKVQQIFTNPKVELAWWIEGAQEQFRVSGIGCIVPAPPSTSATTSAFASTGTDGTPDQEDHHLDRSSLYASFEQFVQSTRSGTETSTGGLASLVRENFDWEKKRVEVFKTMSAYMKASWCRPVPGSPLQGGEDEAKKWPEKVEEPAEGDGNEENRRNWETALRNFALLLVDPIEVDYVELGVVPNRRTKFWRTEEGKWEEMAVVP
ncbi:hypothetical protein D9758_009968 [Tetrapyrgos nigripes]|uniref:Pyridoxamine 5'-phosphate oxidase Alr4036 family FMN-binding domain-containing protein n=1 Tax=Tetrapyrgos nigripes TaxID=182062 RepID=A0A8H5CSC9_9AGAR|nr:hypothetical protein D9758_009968 [Tetrapyrgos nigripes]